MDRDTGDSLAVGAGFAALAVGVAAALVPLRDTLGSANIALIMVLVVVLAASAGGRVGGAIAALAASVAFNFFHTRPYLTVRIDHPQDMATVVLILAVGVAVGELGVARARQSATRRSHLRAIRALEEVGALVSSGASVESVWPAVRDALVSTLGLRRVRFDARVHHPVPVIERDGRVDVVQRRYVRDGFTLPDTGAALDVASEGEFLGQIVLFPNDLVAVSREQRRAAVALADQFAIALKRAETVRSFG